jgi:hypothetical protein
MFEQLNLPDEPELILQRLDKIAAELRLLRETVLTIQDRSEKVSEQLVDNDRPETGNLLPDLREFRASLAVGGESLRSMVLREREEQRY